MDNEVEVWDSGSTFAFKRKLKTGVLVEVEDVGGEVALRLVGERETAEWIVSEEEASALLTCLLRWENDCD